MNTNGVGIAITKEIAKSLTNFWPVVDRVTMVELQGKPFNLRLIQAYVSPQDHVDDEVEIFYDKVQKAITYTMSVEVVVGGYFNAKVGKGDSVGNSVTGKFGLGKRNDRGTKTKLVCDTTDCMIPTSSLNIQNGNYTLEMAW